MDQFLDQLKILSDSIQQSKSDMIAYFDSKVDPIVSTLNGIHNSLSTLGDHVSHLEQRVGANEDVLSDITTRMKQLETNNTYLLNKVDDL